MVMCYRDSSGDDLQRQHEIARLYDKDEMASRWSRAKVLRPSGHYEIGPRVITNLTQSFKEEYTHAEVVEALEICGGHGGNARHLMKLGLHHKELHDKASV